MTIRQAAFDHPRSLNQAPAASAQSGAVPAFLFTLLLLTTFVGLSPFGFGFGGGDLDSPGEEGSVLRQAVYILLFGGMVMYFGNSGRVRMVASVPTSTWLVLGWMLLSVVIVLPYRKPDLAKPLFLAAPLLGLVAAWAAIFKPA